MARKNVTQRDIAEKCGLSVIAVSYALRGDRSNVSQATIDRVRREARRMGYDPSRSHAARRLRYQRTDTEIVNQLVALFFPFGEMHQPYWAYMFEGMQGVLAAQGFGALTCNVDVARGPFREQLPVLFRRGEVDGAIVFATEQYRDELITALREESGFRSRPIVTLMEPFEGCSSVLVDDVAVGNLQAGHLLDLGHRHLLAFRSERYNAPAVRDRIEGYSLAFRERGLDPEAGLHIWPWIWDRGIDLQEAAQQALQGHPAVTALLCPNDAMGIDLGRALSGLGYRVPRDYSMVGVDDTDVWLDRNGQNIWTTVRLPMRDIGSRAASLLLDRIAGGRPTYTSEIISPSLVVRQSTRPVRPRC
jgi:LacI family transcriptional regulator